MHIVSYELTLGHDIGSRSKCGLIRIVSVEVMQAASQLLTLPLHSFAAGYFLVLHKKQLCVFVQMKEDLSPRKTI